MRVNAGVDFISRFAILGDEEGFEGVVVDKEQLHESEAGKFVFNFNSHIMVFSS